MQSSVTEAIAAHFGAPPTVRVHHSGPSALTTWEADLLGCDASTQAFARHITLDVGEHAVLAARTVTAWDDPMRTYLADLGDRPLGTLLFQGERWARASALIPLVEGTATFGRGARWHDAQSGGNLLVEEFFLTPLTDSSYGD